MPAPGGQAVGELELIAAIETALADRSGRLVRWTGDDARYCVHSGEVAIPTSDPGLKHGDEMDCALFPRIWPSNELHS